MPETIKYPNPAAAGALLGNNDNGVSVSQAFLSVQNDHGPVT